MNFILTGNNFYQYNENENYHLYMDNHFMYYQQSLPYKLYI